MTFIRRRLLRLWFWVKRYLLASMGITKYKDGRVHFRNWKMKGLTQIYDTPMSVSKTPGSRGSVSRCLLQCQYTPKTQTQEAALYRCLLKCQSTRNTKAQEAAYLDVYSRVSLLQKLRLKRLRYTDVYSGVSLIQKTQAQEAAYDLLHKHRPKRLRIQMLTPASIYSKTHSQLVEYTAVYSRVNLLQTPRLKRPLYRCLLQCQSTPKTQTQEAANVDVYSSVNLLPNLGSIGRVYRCLLQDQSTPKDRVYRFFSPVSIYSKPQAQEAAYTDVYSSVNLLQTPGSRSRAYRRFLQCQSTPKPRLKRPCIQMFSPVSIFSINPGSRGRVYRCLLQY